jgi:FAD/FMN-containing dehydrogenase
MEKTLEAALKEQLSGDVTSSTKETKKYSRDKSIFERTPSLVVYPKDTQDLMALVKIIAKRKKEGEDVSVTARAAGTCMTGGSLTSSVVAVFTKYMNKVIEVGDGYAITEPGVFYRDFEKETLKKNLLLPSFPASRELAALGGMINNNAGGEKTLEYGKTDTYVTSLDVVLADGTEATFSALTKEELEQKKRSTTLEGKIYREVDTLLEKNRDIVEAARPRVSKNSAGYALWDVIDKERGTFNLAKLIVGAQGTLALVTRATLSLITPQQHRSMLVVFLKDLDLLPEVVSRVLRYNPESFESYDDHTFRLAVRFLPQIIKNLGFRKMFSLGFSFLPEVGLVLRGGVPKLVLMAEFSEDTKEEARRIAEEARASLSDLPVRARLTKSDAESEKYWTIRRESFSLLRKNLQGYSAAPFIDDIVVNPETYPEFLPKIQALLTEYNLVYTIAGHVGNGNFHIIPLMDLRKPETRQIILELTPKVYALVKEYRGSTTGEHNDGIIRTPYLSTMFSPEILHLFSEIKKIFDEDNIFNPGKKVGGTVEDIAKLMIRS